MKRRNYNKSYRALVSKVQSYNVSFKTIFLLFSVVPFFLAIAPEKDITDKTFQEILKSYTIVGDFGVKEETRPISVEIFWRYPLPSLARDYPSLYKFSRAKDDFVATPGGGREFEHLNRARGLFLNGQFDEARATLLTARARYGLKHPYHRRVDFYLGITMLAGAEKLLKESKSPSEIQLRTYYENATTFFSYALVRKKNINDPVIDKNAPMYFYELAQIYLKYKRYSAAYGAAQAGLDFLQSTGRKEFRSVFNTIVAEILVKNREYYKAMQHLDRAIRLDPDKDTAAGNFARMADIYYTLNNFELAEEFYDLAFRIAKDLKKLKREHLILRAECLFWLSRFKEAEKVMEYALSDYAVMIEENPLSPEYISYARLRFADLALAQKNYELSALRYFQARHHSPSSVVKDIAKIRMSCLDLPAYKGKNLGHARSLFDGLKKTGLNLPLEAIEVGETCNVASYAQHERDETMVNKIREFYAKYPNSEFLQKLIPPLQEFRAKAFHDFYNKHDYYGAIAYFEANRQTTFPKIDTALGAKLFYAYFFLGNTEKASIYFNDYLKIVSSSPSLIPKLIQSFYLPELMQLKPKDKELSSQNKALAKALNTNPPLIELAPDFLTYLTRTTALPGTNPHLSWRYELIKSWWPKKPELICQMSFPLLMRLTELNIDEEKKPGRLVNLIDSHYEAKLAGSSSCLSSLLDLEFRMLSDQSELLGRRWESRLDWPLTSEITTFFWRVSEKMMQDDLSDIGKKFLTHIIDKAPPDAPERDFAKLRLDNSQTHLEKLWQ